MILSEGMHEVPAGHLAAVVTYLEMTASAKMDAKPFPAGVTATKEVLDTNTYRTLFRAVGAPWLWTSRLAMDDSALNAILTDPSIEIWVVRKDGAAIAFIELDYSAPMICELAFFGMITAATGQGLGGPMMGLAQTQAFRQNVQSFTVHTCSLDDPRALGFYRKAGFTPVKRGVEVFADPRIEGPHAPTTAPQIPCLR